MKKALMTCLLVLALGGCVSGSGESVFRPVNFELNPVGTNR